MMVDNCKTDARIHAAFSFFQTVIKLKDVERAGWVEYNVPRPESVADHSFGVVLLALLFAKIAPNNLDCKRCLYMALLHDAAESLVGDITPTAGMSDNEKMAREEAAMKELAQMAGDSEALILWKEFEAGLTNEAQFVRDLDLIELGCQSIEYRRIGKLSEMEAKIFLDSARPKLLTDFGRIIWSRVLE